MYLLFVSHICVCVLMLRRYVIVAVAIWGLHMAISQLSFIIDNIHIHLHISILVRFPTSNFLTFCFALFTFAFVFVFTFALALRS